MGRRRWNQVGVTLATRPPLDQRWLRALVEDLRADATPVVGPQLSLMQFVREAWPILEPDRTFVNNWHIEAIAAHLEAVSDGRIQNLLINVPPGGMKSLLVSVCWPAWEWTRHPEYRYLCASYDQQLSTRDNLHMRQLIESSWYRDRWPHVCLAADQNQKTRFNTTRGGWRIGTSVGGRAVGEHPHRKIIDDPHRVEGAFSEAERQEVMRWFDQTLSSRGAALNAPTIVVMQRLHEEDLTGHILASFPDRFVHICLPMRFEPGRMGPTPLHWTDPRTTPGELLWPPLFPLETVVDLETRLGPYGTAGQLQQRPAPEHGGLFQREWFAIVDALPADANIVARVRAWDCAATEGGGDWTVGVRMALTRHGLIYVEDVLRGQWGPRVFEGELGLLRQTANTDGRAIRIREEEEPGSAGKKVIAAHAKLLLGFDYKGLPSSGDKVTRARPFAAQAAVGNVRLVKGAWNKAYLDELTLFPAGRHDDQVDASSCAFNDLVLTPRNVVVRRKLTGF